MRSFALNLLLAVTWLLLSAQPSPERFGLGFLAGFVLLALFEAVLGSDGYVRRVLALGRFLIVFAWVFLAANASVLRTVLFRPRESLQPNFIRYDVSGLAPFETLLLSYCISLTPGSTTVQIAGDYQSLILHTLEGEDAAALRDRLDRVLKQGILNFTR